MKMLTAVVSLFLFTSFCNAASTGTVSGAPVVALSSPALVYHEDTGMIQSSPVFTCENSKVLTTQYGKVTQLELRMDASQITSGAVKDQYGKVFIKEVSVPAVISVSATPLISSTYMTPEELSRECEIAANALAWRPKLIAAIRNKIFILKKP